MAQGRFVNKSISTSHPFNELPSDTDRLLFLMAIPHLDIEGRIEGEPDLLKAKIVPFRRDLTPKRIEKAMQQWCSMRNPETKEPVVLRYEVHGVRYLEFINFKDNQPNLRSDREAASSFPANPKRKNSSSNAGSNSGKNSGETPGISLSLPSSLSSSSPLPSSENISVTSDKDCSTVAPIRVVEFEEEIPEEHLNTPEQIAQLEGAKKKWRKDYEKLLKQEAKNAKT